MGLSSKERVRSVLSSGKADWEYQNSIGPSSCNLDWGRLPKMMFFHEGGRRGKSVPSKGIGPKRRFKDRGGKERRTTVKWEKRGKSIEPVDLLQLEGT